MEPSADVKSASRLPSSRQDVPKTASSIEIYQRLLGYTRKHWKVFALSIAALVVVAATEPAIPAVLRPILDRTFVDKDLSFVKWVPVLLLGLALIRGIASFISDYCVRWVGQKVVTDLRNEMFDRIMRLPSAYFDRMTTGNLMSKFSYDTLQVTTAATTALTTIVKDTLVIIGLLGFLFYTNWYLSLIALTVGPMIVGIVRLLAQRLRRMSRAEQATMGEMNHVLEEAITGQKVVKVFGGQGYETDRFRAVQERVRRYVMKGVVAAAATVPLTQIAAMIAVALIVYLAVADGALSKSTVGEFVAFLAAMLMLLSPLKRLTNVNHALQRGLAAAESVFALLDESPEPDSGTRTLERAHGRIEFRGVSFAHAGTGKEALSDIDLVIAAGETVALVGASGSGKTTLANLVPRFYQPATGSILLDGVDVRELTLQSLRANLAFVSQDVVLFNDTVAANIAYGGARGEIQVKVEAAARAAYAHEFISAMPQGFSTLIGERGTRLSGGQRQRLAIARAFFKDSPVLILDEATSALDSEAERHVQAALEKLMVGRTTVVIAHRFSTIERADRIVVLNEGRIVEIGRHDELIARDGAYARLYRIQYASVTQDPNITQDPNTRVAA